MQHFSNTPHAESSANIDEQSAKTQKGMQICCCCCCYGAL